MALLASLVMTDILIWDANNYRNCIHLIHFTNTSWFPNKGIWVLGIVELCAMSQFFICKFKSMWNKKRKRHLRTILLCYPLMFKPHLFSDCVVCVVWDSTVKLVVPLVDSLFAYSFLSSKKFAVLQRANNNTWKCSPGRR